MKEISVILTVYNQSFADIAFSLASLVVQQDVDFEIVIADDGSKVDRSSEIESFFEEFGFKNYVIARSEVNRKTVANVINGAKQATGKYLKVLGSGDCLFDNKTLRDIVDFCDANSVEIGFGKILRFTDIDGNIDAFEYKAPMNAKDFLPENHIDDRDLLKHMLTTSDWIPGGSQFGKADTMIPLWEKLRYEYGIFYCEDFAATCALAEDKRILFLDRYLMWYDSTGGISTSGNKETVRKMYADNANIFSHVSNDNLFEEKYLFPQFVFSIKKFIALKTPFYGFFQSRLSDMYGKNTVNGLINETLKDCTLLKESYRS